MKIDSHQHFWLYSKEEYDWIGDQETVLKRNFLPADLADVIQANGLDGCVAVQARQTDEETQWLIELAEQNDIVKGVVGWIDLRADTLAQTLEQYQGKSYLKGFRHVLQGEPDPNFMLAPAFVSGLKTLEQHGYSYDLLIFAHQLPQAVELVKQLPNLRIVVDHIAKPAIKAKTGFTEWQHGMQSLATQSNVFCKVSGMVTEADFENWQADEFTPYLDTIFSAFGPERVMFGSDWPVLLLAAEYATVKQIVEDYVNAHFPEHFDNVFGKNACRFYQL